MKQPVKQLTLRTHSQEFPEAVVRSVEEGELYWYKKETGKHPNNLEPNHPAYKLWTYKTKRDGNIPDIVAEYEKSLSS